MVLGLGAALLAAVVFGVAAVLQAIGARRVPAATSLDPRMLLQLLRQPAFLAAWFLNFIGFLLHLVAIRLVPLYLAQAGIAASLVVTAALAVRLFGDTLKRIEWVAVAAVFVGLGLLATAAGEAGQQRAETALNVGLVASLVAIAMVGLVVSRLHGSVVPAVLGLLAGLGFAVDSIAIRLLPGLLPAQLLQSGATYIFLVSACLAVLLYSIALQRGSVTAATAPMIVMQTVTPAIVGVVLLGDGVRAGLLPLATFGLLLTTAGAARLARFEGAKTPQARGAGGPA